MLERQLGDSLCDRRAGHLRPRERILIYACCRPPAPDRRRAARDRARSPPAPRPRSERRRRRALARRPSPCPAGRWPASTPTVSSRRACAASCSAPAARPGCSRRAARRRTAAGAAGPCRRGGADRRPDDMAACLLRSRWRRRTAQRAGRGTRARTPRAPERAASSDSSPPAGSRPPRPTRRCAPCAARSRATGAGSCSEVPSATAGPRCRCPAEHHRCSHRAARRAPAAGGVSK